MGEKKIYILDCNRIQSLNGFYREVTNVLLEGGRWGKNLDAFNDILRGGFGQLPKEGFILRLKNSGRLKRALGVATYNTIIDIIKTHGVGGQEESDGVELVIE